MGDLSTKTCSHCSEAKEALSADDFKPLLIELDNWSVVENHHLTKTFTFPDFVSALARVNEIGDIAENEGHHPDLHLAWGKVRVDLWTHSVDGLTEADFIMAAKIDDLK